MKSVAFKAYLKFSSSVAKSGILKAVGVHAKRIEGFKNRDWANLPVAISNLDEVIHFHAASVGELEVISPIITAIAAKNIYSVITIFSPSAENALKKLTNQLSVNGDKILFSGYSPAEDSWEQFLLHFKVKKSVGSKYEAWPGLWAALSELKIPLIMIQSQKSPSLVWVKRLLKRFSIPLPKLYFFGEDSLEDIFPDSTHVSFPDPRWVQIAKRASKESKRVKEIADLFSNSLKPFGIFGSAWMEDLELFVPLLLGYPGTIFIVPHVLNSEYLVQMENFLLRYVNKEHIARTSRAIESSPPESTKRFVIVDEMGILLELYALADWAYVGGGFTHGVHSTMEPAFFGIPVACGPKRATRFPEIAQLVQFGQLMVCQNVDDFRNFLHANAKEGRNSAWTKKHLDKTEAFSSLVEEVLRVR